MRPFPALLIPALVAFAAGCAGHGDQQPTGRIVVLDDPPVLLVPAAGGKAQPLRIDAFSDVAFSPDERRVAFTSDPDGITIMTLKDGRTTVVPNQPQTNFLSGDLAWAPDGRSLAFVNGETIFTISIDGSGLREVTEGAFPSWTHDGEHIVFVSGWNGNTEVGDIGVIAVDGTGLRFLGRGLNPAVSPSGDEVAYYSPPGVFVRPLAGGAPRLVVPNGFAPVWSPDGRFLAFTRYTVCGHAACSGRVFVVPVKGGKPRAIGPTMGDPPGPEDWVR